MIDLRLPQLRRKRTAAPPRRGLAADARAMRAALATLHAELQVVHGQSAPVRLRAIVADLLEGEIEAPSADVADLIRRGTDPRDFYEGEIAPSWDGLGEAQRAARLEGFIELAGMIDASGEAAGLPPEMAATVHTKALILAWAFDETYGYISRLGRGEPVAD